MRLYHGSSCVVQSPDVARSRGNLDFGRGFYATSIKSQSETWARRKAALEKGAAFVNEYDLDEGKLEGCAILRFPNPDEKWVRFVCDCRRGGGAFKNYDLIIGGVANDRVYYAVDMFYQGGISRRRSKRFAITRSTTNGASSANPSLTMRCVSLERARSMPREGY